MEILESEADVSCGVCGLSHDHMCCDACGAREQVDPNHGTVGFYDPSGKIHATWEQACDCNDTVDGFPKVEVTGECSECGSLQKIRHNHDIPHEYSDGVCEKYFCEEFWEHETGDECEVCECGLDRPIDYLDYRPQELWLCDECGSSEANDGTYIDADCDGHKTQEEACIASNCKHYEELEPQACVICNRQLKTDRARQLGIGSICEKKFQMKTLRVWSKLSENDLNQLLGMYEFVWTKDDIHFMTDRPPYIASYNKVIEKPEENKYAAQWLVEKLLVKHMIDEEHADFWRKITWNESDNYDREPDRYKSIEMMSKGSYELKNLKIDEDWEERWEYDLMEDYDMLLSEYDDNSLYEDTTLLSEKVSEIIGVSTSIISEAIAKVYNKMLSDDGDYNANDWLILGACGIGTYELNREQAYNYGWCGWTSPLPAYSFLMNSKEDEGIYKIIGEIVSEDKRKGTEAEKHLYYSMVTLRQHIDDYADEELRKPPTIEELVELFRFVELEIRA